MTKDLIHHMITFNSSPEKTAALRSAMAASDDLTNGAEPVIHWDDCGDKVKITFSDADIPYPYLIKFAQQDDDLTFVYQYANKAGGEWGVEVWRHGKRVDFERANEMVRRRLWIELFELDPDPTAEWRPVPPPEYIRIATRGPLRKCPACKDSSTFVFYSLGANSFQAPRARDMYREMTKADKIWGESLQRAIGEEGSTFEQFERVHGSRPGISDIRFGVQGVMLKDHWSRTGIGRCTNCGARIWHDFVGSNWHYYYLPHVTPTSPPESEEIPPDSAKNGKAGSIDDFRIITIPTTETTFEDIFRKGHGDNNHNHKNGHKKQADAGTDGIPAPMKVKKLHISGDVGEALGSIQVEFDNTAGHFIGRLPNLSRPLYMKVNEVLEKLGGKWNKKARGHIFKADPGPRLEEAIATGALGFWVDGFIPTPRQVVIDRLLPHLPACLVGKTILEPSAGEGNIADVIWERGGSLICVEIYPERVAILHKKGYMTIQGDFLEVQTLPFSINGIIVVCPGGVIDGVAMNPPFENLADTQHVMHAFDFLKQPGDSLVALTSESPFFRGDKLATRFRQWLDETMGKSFKLPAGIFKQSGTTIAARLVMVKKKHFDQDTRDILEGLAVINSLQRLLTEASC